jgi:hypothetical protein
MGGYDSRRITLDPGLTAIALRGLQSRHEGYPFVERHTRWRRVWAQVARYLQQPLTMRPLGSVRPAVR